MDESAWWPKGVIHDDLLTNESESILTEFGTMNLWNFESSLSMEWWENKPEDGVIWGQWPDVTEVKVLREDRRGIVVRLNPNQIARILPFSCGNDLSRLMRHQPWSTSLKGLPVTLPSMIYFVDEDDRVAVYDCPDLFDGEIFPRRDELAKNLGLLHKALNDYSTPNTERRWNDRLKDIEGQLKTNTLWRAPHTEQTVGLPRLNVDIEMLALVDGTLHFIADSRTPLEHLLCEPDRLPGLANLMMIEQQFSFNEGMNEESRESMLKSWLSTTPSSYGKAKALSTLLGGPWIWRYHAVLLALGEAKMYGDKELRKKAMDWLNDVSRIQAHLGVLRLWKSGLWGGLSGVIIAFFAWKLETLSPTASGILGLTSLILAVVSNQLYWAKDPKPY